MLSEPVVGVACPALPMWPVRLIRLVTAGYWVSMCVGTHVPNPPDVVPTNVSDTWLHLAAYFGLSVLLVGSVADRGRLSVLASLRLWAVVLVYGALDEWTQMIPVLHRTAEWKDFAADAAGSAGGLIFGSVLVRLCPGRLRGGGSGGDR